MTAAARDQRLNRVTVSCLGGAGEPVTFTRQGETSGIDLGAVITRRLDPIWSGGQVAVAEDHFTGYLLSTALQEPPAIGDQLSVADGTCYVIDQAPECDRGLWSLVLRRYPHA
jgi:hypothetical protein